MLVFSDHFFVVRILHGQQLSPVCASRTELNSIDPFLVTHLHIVNFCSLDNYAHGSLYSACERA